MTIEDKMLKIQIILVNFSVNLIEFTGLNIYLSSYHIECSMHSLEIQISFSW